MRIQEMFYDDIDRKINGVVKVDQDAADVLKQEVKEYVITRDIRKHMITFFNNYAESFGSQRQMWACGSPDSSEVVNLIS